MGLLKWLTKIGYTLIRPVFLCDEQLSELERNIVLEERYRWFLQYNNEDNLVTADQLLEAFKRLYGVDPVFFFACDEVYYVAPTLGLLRKWVKYDWTNKLDYIVNTFDCDNFAALFATRTRLITGWAVTWTVGEIRRLDNNELIGYHAFCTCYYLDGKEVRAIAHEPQTNELSENARFTLYDEDGRPFEVYYKPIDMWPQVTV